MPKNKGKVSRIRKQNHPALHFHRGPTTKQLVCTVLTPLTNRVARTVVVERTKTTMRSVSSHSRRRVKVCFAPSSYSRHCRPRHQIANAQPQNTPKS